MTDSAVRDKPGPVVLLLGILVALFALLGLVAHRATAGTALDHEVLHVMLAHRTPALTTAALVVTNVFSPVGTGLLAVVVAAVAWWRFGSRRAALLVLGTLAGAGAASTLAKVVVGAHRPPHTVQLIAETDGSFPSGHVTGTLALLGVLAVVIGRHRGRTARTVLAAVAALATVVVGLTRLYLGVHWASDVVGGVLLGASAVALAYLAQRMTDPVASTGPAPPTGVLHPSAT